MADMAKLTKGQKATLIWLAENPEKRSTVAYGQRKRMAYALLSAGLIERTPGQFDRLRITATGLELVERVS